MRYSGSKSKFADKIIEIISKNLSKKKYYIEPFCGGCNVIDKVDCENKIANDSNWYVCELWKSIQNGWIPPKNVTRERYYQLKKLSTETGIVMTDEDAAEIGYVGNSCSNGSAWFNGYANFNKKRNENHILEAYNNIIKQIENFKGLKDIRFISKDYSEIEYPSPSDCVIYCDPPYASTKQYADKFDSERFWKWVKKMGEMGYEIYVSEYSAPDFMKCIWKCEKKDGMKNCCKGERQNTKIEKLFVFI